jgi:tetratricopeptide (TPR) repeat protein
MANAPSLAHHRRTRSVAAWGFAVAIALAALASSVVAAPAPARPANAAGGTPPGDSARAAMQAIGAPASLAELSPWLDYKVRAHLAALPQEARLFYRRGVLAREAGRHEEATRLVRGAAELDPGFVAPHMTLAAWYAADEPSLALLQLATVLNLARQNFMLQLALFANSLYLGLQALVLGLLGVAMLVVVVRQRELRHPWIEELSRRVNPETARWWSLAFMVLPYLAGFGPVLPTLFFLGILWPVLRLRERAVSVLLLAVAIMMPAIVGLLDRVATPLNENRAPLYGVPLYENEPHSPERQRQVEALAVAHPDNAFLQFGLAWTARRGGDLATAERAYRRALELDPRDDRAMNNLGNVMAMLQKPGRALELYQAAVEVNPRNAAAHFNASQIHTQRFDYAAASAAIERASALDFDLVKNHQSQGTTDGLLPLADQWIEPERFWVATGRERIRGPVDRSVPPSWRHRVEAAGWPFSLAALLFAGLGLALGARLLRRAPLRACSNCGTIVCRRCAQRRREVALCPSCATVEGRAESPEFARVMLLQHRSQIARRQGLVRTITAALIPGYGLVSHQRVITPLILLSISAALLSSRLGMAPPFSYELRLATADSTLPMPLLASGWLVVYALSFLGFLARENQARAQAAMLAAPTRSRSIQATRRIPPAAAA